MDVSSICVIKLHNDTFIYSLLPWSGTPLCLINYRPLFWLFRFCEFPQELIVAFDRICDISQIQILSHQSKISSKIEIYMGLGRGGTITADYKDADFKRLGYESWLFNLYLLRIDLNARFSLFHYEPKHIAVTYLLILMSALDGRHVNWSRSLWKREVSLSNYWFTKTISMPVICSIRYLELLLYFSELVLVHLYLWK